MRRFVRFKGNGMGLCMGLWEDGGIRVIDGDPPIKWEATDRVIDPGDVELLPPCQPSKVVAVGLNYADHAKETNNPLPEEPILFMKPSTSVIGPGEAIKLPPMSKRVDYEAELAVVIGKRAKGVSEGQAWQYIWGLTCLNDVTARDLQARDGQWTRAKGFDTFCPIGPWIVSGIDARGLGIKGILNGEVRQSSSTDQLIFSVEELVAFVSSVMTLLPGDVIATGTPSGIGPMKNGDRFQVVIEGVGTLENPVVG